MRVWLLPAADGSLSSTDLSLILIGLSTTPTVPVPPVIVLPDYKNYIRKFLGDSPISQVAELSSNRITSSSTVSGLNLSYIRRFLGDVSITQGAELSSNRTTNPNTVVNLNLDYIRKFLGDT